MKLPKAIEILNAQLEMYNAIYQGDILDALKLGIEALEYCEKLKWSWPFPDDKVLPDETKD